jgi:hypothetical protein
MYALVLRGLRCLWLLGEAIVALGFGFGVELCGPGRATPVIPELNVAFCTQRASLDETALLPHEIFDCDGLV